MTDLEITKLCAEALGLETLEQKKADGSPILLVATDEKDLQGFILWNWYFPLQDDLQAMELLRKFGLNIVKDKERGGWCAHTGEHPKRPWTDDLNRAICECVAKMQQSKQRANTLLAGVQRQG